MNRPTLGWLAWARSRGLVASAMTCLVVPVAIVAAGEREMPVLDLVRAEEPVFLVSLTALLLVIAVARVQARRHVVEFVGVRRCAQVELAVISMLVLLTAAASAAVQIAALSANGFATARNCLGLFGAYLLIPGRSAVRKVTAVTAYAVLMVQFARALDTQPEQWAWIASSTDHALSWLWAGSLLLVGMLAAILRQQPRFAPLRG